ncbi:MAG TPA: cysteine--tRNA ligase [bacterium]|nr:cysteine--tRNA ligase [bacterium]HPT29625.1 cysteine--tRNA ligase [bacterium]
MATLKLYNTLTRSLEDFKPRFTDEVGLYTCGPTVYNFAHLGNLRAYVFEDILKRVLNYNGYQVKHVMNITDVGHLVGDGNIGEDKIEAGATREGKTAWEVAEFYTQSFKKDIAALNIIPPTIWAKATDYIEDQIKLIEKLVDKGYTYQTSDGLYFNTAKIEHYNKLSHLPLEDLKEGARVEKNPEKINPTDFALWKFSPLGQKRQMEWPSPWGVGFPGWHIECSAISLSLLGEHLDIHCGGIDHINVHHTNEIAQSEAATSQKFFDYWMHNAFLVIAGGKKMAKSEANFLTLDSAVISHGIDPLAYRLALLNVHYRKPAEYTPEIIEAANNALEHLRNQVSDLGTERGEIDSVWQEKFLGALNDDLNTPQALAVVSEMLKSSLPNQDKLATIIDFEKVLALDLISEIPAAITKLAQERDRARENKDYAGADKLRQEIEGQGYSVKDGSAGSIVMKK